MRDNFEEIFTVNCANKYDCKNLCKDKYKTCDINSDKHAT